MTRAEFVERDWLDRARTGTLLYDSFLARFPITAWDDTELRAARRELTTATPGDDPVLGDWYQRVHDEALAHVEQEIERRALDKNLR